MASASLLKRLEFLELRIGNSDGMPASATWDYLGVEDYDSPCWRVVREAEGATLLQHAEDGRFVVLPHGGNGEGVYA